MGKKRNYFTVHRGLLSSDRWLSEPFTRGQAWVDMFGLTQHSPGHIRVRGIRVDLKRGQLGYSQLTLAKRWGWSRGKVRRYLKELEKNKDIVQQKNRVTTLIAIVKYDKWQLDSTTDSTTDGQQTDNRRTTDGTLTSNGKKNNNGKKGEKEKPPFFDLIEKRKLKTDIRYSKYQEMRSEYKGKLAWWPEVKKCIDWCYDKNLENLSSQRLRNWMNKSIEFNKEKELKEKQKYQDKKDQPISQKPIKKPPLWKPPL